MTRHSASMLDTIRYLPAIRSRQAELRGYRELRPETKAALCPIVALGRIGRQADPARVLDGLREGIGTYFLDINTLGGQQCDGWEALCDPADNYANWRNFAATADNAIPVAILRDGVHERPFVRQALAIEQSHGVVVVRSRRPGAELAALQAVISAIEDVNNLMIVLDFGYVRGSLEARETEARRVITALRTTDSAVRIAVIASSYPRAVSAFGEERGALEIIERDLHLRLGGDDVAIYGDHASIYPEYFEPTISRFVPRIDYCTDAAWLYRRFRDETSATGVVTSGYVLCARAIVRLPEWEPEFANQAWGAGIIRDTEAAGTVPQGFGSPANWIAARVNMHIERQHALASVDPEAWDEDEDGED